MLKESGADQLFVGMGSPKQDIFIYENMEKYQIPVSYSMGAAIDFIGGSVKRAPKWMSDVGLEWFHRMMQNPKRLVKRYLVDDRKILKYYRKFRKQEKARADYEWKRKDLWDWFIRTEEENEVFDFRRRTSGVDGCQQT